MRILFDQGTPQPLRRQLAGHTVETVFELGWSTLKNGQLFAKAEEVGYDVLVTTDQNLHYQQNLSGRRLAILVLMTTSWPRIRPHAGHVQRAIDSMTVGVFREHSFDVHP